MPLINRNNPKYESFYDPFNPLSGTRRKVKHRLSFSDFGNILLVCGLILIVPGIIAFLIYHYVHKPEEDIREMKERAIRMQQSERVKDELNRRRLAEMERTQRMAEEEIMRELEMRSRAELIYAASQEPDEPEEIVVPEGVEIQFIITPEKTDWVYLASAPKYERIQKFADTVPDLLATELEQCMLKVHNKPIPKATTVQMQIAYDKGKKPALKSLTEDKYLSDSLDALQKCMKAPVSKLRNTFQDSKLTVTLDMNVMSIP